MITRIEIDGFKSFVDFELDVPPFLVLVGANNGGKSNLLEAIEFAHRMVIPGGPDVLFDHERGNARELFHRHPDGTARTGFRIGFSIDGGDIGQVMAQDSPDLGVTVTSDVPRASLPGLRTIRRLAPSPEAMRSPSSLGDKRSLTSDGSNLAAVINRLADSGDLMDLLIDAVAIISKLSDIEPRVDKERSECDFVVKFRAGDRFRPNLLSDATLRVLAILAAVHDRSDPATLLIDEIETSLHPGFLWELLRRLRNHTADGSGRQIIAATHSPVVVSHLLPDDPGSVRFLSQWTGGVLTADGSMTACSHTRALPFATKGERGMFVPPPELRSYMSTVRSFAEVGAAR
jgi:hypothetical protein